MRESMSLLRNRLFGVLVLGAGIATALTTPAGEYDPEARNTLSPNDVKAFVYQWFAGFDHQAPLETFTRHLDPAGVTIQYPDFPVNSVADFQRWYQGVIDNIAWNTHEVQKLEVVRQANNGFEVTLEVCWRARTYQGEALAMRVEQQWQLTVNANNQLRLRRLFATAKGAC